MKVRCPNCGGVGVVISDSVEFDCDTCKGTGLGKSGDNIQRSCKMITLRITPNEKEAIERKAHMLHMSENEYCRQVLSGMISNGFEEREYGKTVTISGEDFLKGKPEDLAKLHEIYDGQAKIGRNEIEQAVGRVKPYNDKPPTRVTANPGGPGSKQIFG